mgnify:CR=1 FL=1
MIAQRQITGKISNSDDGSTIPGVSVVVKGTTVGTITDIDGKYQLIVPEGGKTLVFSFVGMKTKEIAIDASKIIDVVLDPDVTQVDEVVITAIGISREKKALGYSVQEVKGEDLNRGNNADVINSISGRAAGVNVNSSGGTAGASSFITIRGAASIEGNNQPLFVVDGMPIETGLNWSGSEYQTEGVNTSSRSIDLNSEDIASVTVLKGGAATALYGVQAANGVILITTKKGGGVKGKDGRSMKVDYSFSVSKDVLSNTIPLQTEYSQGNNGNWISGYSGTWGAKLDSMGYSNYFLEPDLDAYPAGPDIINPGYPNDYTIWSPDYDVDGAIVGQDYVYGTSGEKTRAYDQYDFFEPGISFNHNVSISSGTDKTSYYFSVGNLDQKGIIPNNAFNRTSVRLNTETKLSNRIVTGGHANFIHSKGNFIQNGSNLSGIMLGLTRTPSSFDNSAGHIFNDGTQRTYRNGGGYNNPYWSANENYFDDRTSRFIGDFYFKINFTEWMNLSYTIGSDWYTRRYTDFFAVNDKSFGAGRLEESAEYNQIFNSNLLLNFTKEISENIRFNGILGHNLYENKSKILRGLANDISIPGFDWLENTSKASVTMQNANFRTSAVFGDFRFDINNMLYLGGTFRKEWASTMPEDNLASLYPSFNLGFVFTELLPESSVFNFGKIRTSWAKTANIAQVYSTSSYYAKTEINDGWTGGIDFPFRQISGYEVDYLLGNSDLVHESMITYEIGTDLKFFNNRLGLDVSYFKNDNEDLLIEVPVATSSGYNNVYMNAASIESKGFELMGYITPIKTKDFTWNIIANFSKLKNTVTELAEGVDDVFLGGFTDPQVRAVVGQDYGSIYGYDWWRAEDGTVLINDDPDDAHPDGFPWTCDTAQVPLGTISPDWTMNISNTFSYKGFSLYALIDIKHGGKMYNGTRFTLNYFGQTEETLDRDVVYLDEENRIIDYENTPEENIVVYDGYPGHLDANGDPTWSETDNTQQVVNDQDWFRGHGGNFGGGPTAAAIEDAGWVRLREITLAYKFNEKIYGHTGFIHGLEIFFTGRNLFLSTPYKGIDPETSLTGARNSQGFDYFNNPGTKTYTFGVRVSL